MTEYALLLAMVALLAVAGLTMVGHRTANAYSCVTNGLGRVSGHASPPVRPVSTKTPGPTLKRTPRPTQTPKPSKTPRPTRTPRPM
jgi:Flp pilus assembly pilin Flp